MKYVLQTGGTYAAFDETSDTYTSLLALPKDVRPVFLAATDKGVKAFIALQAEAAKPKRVTMRQARLALMQAGLLDNVQNAMAGMQGVEGTAARIEWEYSNEMSHGQPLIVSMASVLKLTDADVDALFLTASRL
jgi:hypothetical protein